MQDESRKNAAPSQSAFAGFADFYRRGPYAACVSDHRRIGSGGAAIIRALQAEGEYPDVATPSFWLGLKQQGVGGHVVDVGSGRWRGLCRPGDLVLVPPGTATDFRQEVAAGFLYLELPAPCSDEDYPADFRSLHDRPFRDPLVESCCERLWTVAGRSPDADLMFSDALLQTILHALKDRSSAASLTLPSRTPLSPLRLRRCIDYMHAHLDEPLGLAALAASCGTPVSVFPHAFKAATGLAPHRYLVTLRLDRARWLMAGSADGLADIALACGFASQEHFTRHFTRRFGTSPGAFRRALA